MLDEPSGAMGYREIAQDLRRGIEDGTYQVGNTLPRQRELAERYSVNVGTVRRAVGLLAREGLVKPIRRRGTVVREQAPKLQRLGSDRYAKQLWKYGGVVAFAADREVTGVGWRKDDQTQRVERVGADSEIAEAFELTPGASVYMRARLITDKEGPTHTLTSYYLPEHVEGTPLVEETPGPASPGGGFAVLTLQGLEPDYIKETVYARMPTPEEADELNVPVGEPVMILERRTYTADHRLVEFARGVHRASKFAWTYDFKIPDKP
jgi:GntR family transcriptional regulator